MAAPAASEVVSMAVLFTAALAQAFGHIATVSTAADLSGGHANPAVTLTLAIASHISVPVGILYWMSQLLGATVACFVLPILTGGEARDLP